MSTATEFEIFLAVAPGLEKVLHAEARTKGFKSADIARGGVAIKGGWRDVWRANLEIRGASRVIARIGSFRAFHLAQLDKRARRIAWGEILRREIPFRVEATCRNSKIYHSGAAAQRIERAIKDELGAAVSPEAEVCIRVRIDDDLCFIGIDTSGELLHKRGHKEAVNRAPMRENLAALFLRQCGFDGEEPVLDPMCGSGTFVIEAAEIAAGLQPGRSRRFAFEQLATFDPAAWQQMRSASASKAPAFKYLGSDLDPGAIRISRANAERAGVSAFTEFRELAIEDLVAPDCPPGLVVVNPPYGDRIGDKTRLQSVYRTLGHVLMTRFAGWRVGLVTSEPALARATGLPFKPPTAPVSHGGVRVVLYLTEALG